MKRNISGKEHKTSSKLISLLAAIFLIALAGLVFTQAGGQQSAKAADKAWAVQGNDLNGKQGRSGPIDQSLPGSPALTTTYWTNINPNLYAVGAASSTEAWSVGQNGHALHYTGGNWVVDDQPAMAGSYLGHIAMLSPTSGWIPAIDKAFFYDGTSWVEKSAGLGGPYPALSIRIVSPISDNDVWGIGYKGGNTFAHWDGTTWTAGPTYTSTTHLNDIVMESATSGWATGSIDSSQQSTPILFHYDGTTWAQLPGPPNALSIVNMSLAAPGDVWVTGRDSTNANMVYRYTNGAWSSWVNPGVNAKAIYMESPTRGWVVNALTISAWDGSTWSIEYSDKRMVSISGSGGQVWAAGNGDMVLARTDSTPWALQHAGITQASLLSVSTLSMDDAWAVGSDGYCTPAVIHYTGGTWQSVPANNLSGCLWHLQMLSSTDGYIADSDGIGHWDGANWQQDPATTGQQFQGLYMTGSGEGWAVGIGGIIWRDTGGVWMQTASPTGYDLYSVAMDSPSHGWAVGGGYDSVNNQSITILLEYDGTNWVDRSDTVASIHIRLLAVALNAAGEGWAVGFPDVVQPNTPAALHLSNGVWSVIPDATSDSGLVAVTTEANDEAWLVGYGYPDYYHYVGGLSEAVAIPGDNLRDISLVPGRGGWAVSANGGQILQYNPLADGRRFYDVPVGSTFYSYIECMASNGIISGYQADNTFRPNNNVTRGQISKIIALSANYQDPPGAQLFEDVLPGSTFFTYVQQLAIHDILSGYACGGPSEPCGPNNLPYFRPNNNASRGQITKIVSNAAGYNDPPGSQLFEDVAPGSTFYDFIQRLASRSIMGGYACGGVGEPCGPGNLPYFRPSANATRGQTSKIVTNTFFPTCSPVSRK